MSNNPHAGRVPLNLRTGDAETVAKSTSFRPGETHRVPVRSQYQDQSLTPRNPGCTPLRRYPNGTLDIKFVAGTIISLINKAKNQGKLTSFEMALLTIILPSQFQFQGLDSSLAGTQARITDEEKILLRLEISGHMKEVENFNAGYGGGSVPGRHSTNG